MPYLTHLGLSASLALFALAAFGQPLTLEDAQREGLAQSPRLAAQRHALDAAREQAGRAGELPDPQLRLGIENLPVSGEDRFRYDRDFMTARTIGFAQAFPSGAKREARSLRASRASELEAADLLAQRALLERDIALAWLELYYAERARAAIGRLAGQFQLHLDALAPAIARGRQGAAEALALRQALEQVNDRLIERERMVERARIALAAWIGAEARRPLADAPDTARFRERREELLARLAEHPQLRAFERREALARAEVDLARSTRKSDWMLEVGYGQRRPYFENMLSVMVSFDLPWQAGRRQDRDIAAALAQSEQARELREDARRMQEAQARGALADFDAAQRRIERYEAVVLPLGRERVAAATAAYRGGRGELGGVLEAERALTEAELGLVEALAERAKAWAQLNYLAVQGASQ